MEGGKHEENNKARLNIKETQNLQLQEMKLKIRKQRINDKHILNEKKTSRAYQRR